MILKASTCCSWCPSRCTLHPNDSLAMEGPLSRVKSLKKSLRQSFRRIRKSRVSGKKRTITTPTSKVSDGLYLAVRAPYRTSRLNAVVCLWLCYVQVQEANAALAEQEDVAPVQRRIEPRSADDSLSGVVRCLCFADTFLRDGVFTYSWEYQIKMEKCNLDSAFSTALTPFAVSCIHQVRTTAPRFGRAPTRAVCTPTLWKCPVWVRGAHASVGELARAACVWRRCWVKKSSWCTGPPWCPFVCWMAGGSRYQTHTKPPRTSPSRQIWPMLTLC